MSYTMQMMTRTELSKALSSLNAAKVADVAKVSTKTIYRIRQNAEYMPNLTTFMSLERAVKALSKPKRVKVAA